MTAEQPADAHHCTEACASHSMATMYRDGDPVSVKLCVACGWVDFDHLAAAVGALITGAREQAYEDGKADRPDVPHGEVAAFLAGQAEAAEDRSIVDTLITALGVDRDGVCDAVADLERRASTAEPAARKAFRKRLKRQHRVWQARLDAAYAKFDAERMTWVKAGRDAAAADIRAFRDTAAARCDEHADGLDVCARRSNAAVVGAYGTAADIAAGVLDRRGRGTPTANPAVAVLEGLGAFEAEPAGGRRDGKAPSAPSEPSQSAERAENGKPAADVSGDSQGPSGRAATETDLWAALVVVCDAVSRYRDAVGTDPDNHDAFDAVCRAQEKALTLLHGGGDLPAPARATSREDRLNAYLADIREALRPRFAGSLPLANLADYVKELVEDLADAERIEAVATGELRKVVKHLDAADVDSGTIAERVGYAVRDLQAARSAGVTSRSRLRGPLLALWQDYATSSDEPDNDALIRWVRMLIVSERDNHRAAKDAHAALAQTHRTLAEAEQAVGELRKAEDDHVGAAVSHLNMAAGMLKSARRRITGDYPAPNRNLDPLGPLSMAAERVADAKAFLVSGRPARDGEFVPHDPAPPVDKVCVMSERHGWHPWTAAGVRYHCPGHPGPAGPVNAAPPGSGFVNVGRTTGFDATITFPADADADRFEDLRKAMTGGTVTITGTRGVDITYSGETNADGDLLGRVTPVGEFADLNNHVQHFGDMAARLQLAELFRQRDEARQQRQAKPQGEAVDGRREPGTNRLMAPLDALRHGETEMTINPGTIGERTIRVRRRMHRATASRPIAIVSFRRARDGVGDIPGMYVIDGVTSLTVDDADRLAGMIAETSGRARAATPRPEPVDPTPKPECRSRIAHETGVVIQCGMRHVIPDPPAHCNLDHPEKPVWTNDDDRVINDSGAS